MTWKIKEKLVTFLGVFFKSTRQLDNKFWGCEVYKTISQ